MKLYYFILMMLICGSVNAESINCISNNGIVLKEIFLDLDHDGKKEALKLVKNENKCKAENAISPWYGEYHVDSAELNNTSFLLISDNHKTQIIYDSEDPSILDTSAAESLNVINKIEAIRLSDELKKSKGDVLILPTESGIDSYLYWDGEKYQVLFPSEEP